MTHRKTDDAEGINTPITVEGQLYWLLVHVVLTFNAEEVYCPGPSSVALEGMRKL
jgi:hypothetical protein